MKTQRSIQQTQVMAVGGPRCGVREDQWRTPLPLPWGGPGRRGAGGLCLEEERPHGRLEIPEETDEALPQSGCDRHGSAEI